MSYSFDALSNICQQLDFLYTRSSNETGCLSSRIITKMNSVQLREFYNSLENNVNSTTEKLNIESNRRSKPWKILSAVLLVYSFYAFVRIVQFQLDQKNKSEPLPAMLPLTGGTSISLAAAIILSQMFLCKTSTSQSKQEERGRAILAELSAITHFSEQNTSYALTLKNWYSKFRIDNKIGLKITIQK